MPPKKIAPPIDRPLSKAYLRQFRGWSTAYPPHMSEPQSLRMMDNVHIDRNGAVEVRPGLNYLSYTDDPAATGLAGTALTEPVVGSTQVFYTNTGGRAMLFAVRRGLDNRIVFKALQLTAAENVVRDLTDPAMGFILVGGTDAISFDPGVGYVEYLQIDNRILALPDDGSPAILFNVGRFKTAKKLSTITVPRWEPDSKLTVYHPDAAWVQSQNPSIRKNLIPNPSFETGTDFWLIDEGAEARTTEYSARAADGFRAVALTSRPTRTNMMPWPLIDIETHGTGPWEPFELHPGEISTSGPWMSVGSSDAGRFAAISPPVTEGIRERGRYSVAANVQGDGASPVRATVLFYAANNSFVSASSTFVIPPAATAGRKLLSTIEVPDGAAMLRLLLGGEAPENGGYARFSHVTVCPEGEDTSIMTETGGDYYWDPGLEHRSVCRYHPPRTVGMSTDSIPVSWKKASVSSIHARGPAGLSLRTRHTAYTTGDAIVDDVLDTRALGGDWVRGAAGTARTDVRKVRTRVEVPDLPRGVEVLFNNAMLESGASAAGTYFDGSSDSADPKRIVHRWDGEAHASISIRSERTTGPDDPVREAPTANTLVKTGGAEANPYKMGFYYVFENEVGETPPSQVTEIRTQRSWSDWRWETANASGEPSGTETDNADLCADQLLVQLPTSVFEQAVAEGAVRWTLYAMIWSDQQTVPVEGTRIREIDLYPDPIDPDAQALDYAVSGMAAVTPSREIGIDLAPLPDRYAPNNTDPPRHATGLVAGDRLILVGDPLDPATIRWSSNRPGDYLNFSPAKGGGLKTLSSGNINIPSSVVLWQNPQSVDTLTILCTTDNAKSMCYYMQPADQQSSSSGGITFMGFEETTNTPGSDSPYATQVLNNALYRPLDHGLLKSTANNYNINHTIQTDPIANVWRALESKRLMVAEQLDNRLYYLVHNPLGKPLRNGCRGNEIWVMDNGVEGGNWARWTIQANSLKAITLGDRSYVGVLGPDGIAYLDPEKRNDDFTDLDGLVRSRPIEWSFETNTQGANRAHDAWAHLQQVTITLGSFTGGLEYGVHGISVDGKMIDARKVVRSGAVRSRPGMVWSIEDMLQVRRDMKEWVLRVSSIPGEESWGQVGLVQYRYTPVSVNVGYEFGSVETFEYGSPDSAYARAGIPRTYLDYSQENR